MANANTNLMSINIASASSNATNSGNSKLGYKTSSKGTSDFNSALDRANNTINRQAAPQNPADAEEISYTDTATQNPESPVESKSATQGQNQQPQDAPKSVPQNQAADKNIPAEIDSKNILSDAKVELENILPNDVQPEIPNAPDVQNILPFMFNAPAETLLPAQITDNAGEVNLMAVMPQPEQNQGQTMLNILSGKTWTAEDVQATLTAQNPQPAEVNPDALNFPQNAKNFTFTPNQNQDNNQPQIFTRQATLTPEVQVQPANANPTPTPQNLQNPLATLDAEQVLQPTVQRQIEIQNQPILNSVQPQVEPKQANPQNLTDLIGGNLQVETQNAPLSPIQPTLRQQPEQNQQQSAQNFQAQDSNAEVQTQTSGEDNFTPNIAPTTNNTVTQTITETLNPENTAQAPRENQSVPAQIVEQARLIRTAENTEMVINLKPEHLGQLTLRVSVSQNGAVNASFYSDNAQVRAAIENSIVQLKQELSDQGLKVDNVQVSSYLSDGGLTNGQGGQAWQQQQHQPTTPGRIDFDALQEEVDAVTPATETVSADGVDYKI